MNQNTTSQPPPNQDSGTASDLRQNSQQLGSTAANRLHSEVDARKGAAVSQAQSVSSAIKQTAEGLGEGSPEWLKAALQQGAQQIQRLADAIEQKESRQMMSEAQNFARDNPGTFLAACAAVGFAAARILKAGGEQQRTQQLNENQSFAANPSYGQSQAFPAHSEPPRTVEPSYGSSTTGSGVGASSPGGFA